MEKVVGLPGKRVVVTGGAGFIGSNIVNALAEQGASVVALDDISSGSPVNLAAGSDLVEGSVEDADLLRRIMKDADLVIHAAARSISASTRDPFVDCQVNIVGTLNVLQAARDTRIGRVVYTSSASVYGNPKYLPANEDDNLNVLTPYSVSKLAGENYCRAFYETYGVPTVSLRYSNVYGPCQRTENPYCGVIAKFLEAALADRPFVIHGDGEQTRDYTFVTDIVNATLRAATNPRAEGHVYNVGTGRETSVNVLARTIAEATHLPFRSESVGWRDVDNIRRRAVNIEKIRRELRWFPVVTLEEGIRRTFQWMVRENPGNVTKFPSRPLTALAGSKTAGQ